MPQLAVWKLELIKPDPRQPRKHWDQTDLKNLGASMRDDGQRDPVQVMADGTLIDGERRWRAAGLVGITELSVIITDRKLSDKELMLWRLTSFFHKADISGGEKWQALADLMCANPTWQMKDAAEALHLDPSMVTRLLSPSKCIPAWQEALVAGKVAISACYAASKCSPEEQAGMLAAALNGASRDELEAQGRKKRAAAPAIRVSRCRVSLQSGVQIVVSGSDLSLDELIESLAEAGKEARKAREQGSDVKAFNALMKAKAAG